MNTNVLQKCVDELKKPEPNFGYLRGMLEAMMDMQEVAQSKAEPDLRKVFAVTPVVSVHSKVETTEAEIIDAKAKAAIAEVKRMAGESTSNA